MLPTTLSLLIRAGDYWWVSSEVGKEAGNLRAKVWRAKLLPPVRTWEFWDEDYSGDNDDNDWHYDHMIKCSKEVKWEERRKENEERVGIGQPLAAKVDAAAKKGEIAYVKQLQLETTGIDVIINTIRLFIVIIIMIFIIEKININLIVIILTITIIIDRPIIIM